MAEYINIKDVKNLIEVGIEDSWELDYISERLKNIDKADVIERSKINKAIEEMNNLEEGLIMECDEMRDYCVEILKRNIGE